MEDKEWVLKNVEEICADTRDTDEICMALEHSTIFAAEMIQNLTQTIFDLQKELSKIKKENEILEENAEHNDKVVDKVNWENMLLNGKLKKIEEYVKGHQLFGMRFGKILYRECLEHILKIIKGDEDK